MDLSFHSDSGSRMGEELPSVLAELNRAVIGREILHNIGLFILLMLIGKFFSFLWKFRLYRKSVKRQSTSKKIKVSRTFPHKLVEDINSDDDPVVAVRKPDHAYRVRSREALKANIKVGQHYAVRREYLTYPLYHHVLVSECSEGQVKILHYNGEIGVFLRSASKIFGHVVEDRIDLEDNHYFDIPDNLYHIRDPDYPSDDSVVKDIIHKARQRIGENRYGITYNNCEHFVRWALTGKPHCQQYVASTITDKVVGAMVDELPNIGLRMSMKICKEILFAITLGVEQMVLQSSARLIQHTASASVASILSTGAATFGWTSPVEAAFLTFRILDWKYHQSKGTMNERDYNNAKDKAITGSVFSLLFTTLGAMVGQLVIPLPALGAVVGSFWGGFAGRLLGIVLAGYGIAVKEKFLFDVKYKRWRIWFYRKLSKSIDRWKAKISPFTTNFVSLAVIRKDKRL